MSTTTRFRSTIAAIIAASALGFGGVAVAQAAPWTSTSANAAANSTLPSAVAKQLQFNREEERLARDLYQLFSDTYDGAAPFSMIVNAEQRHFDAVGRLLTSYGIDDPSAGRPAGSYADATLQKLYTEWKAQGLQSQLAAAKVGVALEKQDIADLDKAIASINQADVTQVLSRLRNGSQHHLAAFTAAAAGNYINGQQGGGSSTGCTGSAGNQRGMNHTPGQGRPWA